jgi:hypothetical protein
MKVILDHNLGPFSNNIRGIYNVSYEGMPYLISHKIYNATIDHSGGIYKIMCDDNIVRYFPSALFITLDEYRESQIDKII